jgi:cellulose synthase/poly-beta-1,6-N-acetylglucosamine synthase-like glycosyltransferase
VAELCRQRRRWRAGGILASKPLVLVHLAIAMSVAAVVGFVLWPIVLLLLTGALYLRAIWAIGFGRKRTGLMLHSPGIVLRLGWLTMAGLVRKELTPWERTARTRENQAA